MKSKEIKSEKIDTSLIQKATIAMLSRQRAPWEQGVATQALMELGEKESVVVMADEAVLRSDNNGRLGMMGGGSTVTDPASNGPGVLEAYKITGDEKFKEAADAMYKYLKEKAPRTTNGTIRHFTSRTQIWSDSVFMAPPFIAFYGDYDEAIKQIEGYLGYLQDKDTKLIWHKYDDERDTFPRKEFWGGGNGWSAAGMAQIIDVLPKQKQTERLKLIDHTKQLLDGCIAHMRPDGLFHDVIDKPETFVETNLSQMLAYTIYKGVKSGWLEEDYLEAAGKMRAAAHKKIDRFGLVHDACGSPRFNKPGTSTEAQAFFLMAEAAYSRIL
jgi:rhamnogalacturonyl hydrolase YesR